MSKNSGLARYKQLKEWYYIFNRNRKYSYKKKKPSNPISNYYMNKDGKIVFIEDEE